MKVIVLIVAALSAQTTQQANTEFSPLNISVQQGGKTKEVSGFLRYEPEQLVIGPMRPPGKKQTDPSREWKYSDIGSAEYTYAKTPHYSAAVLVSPLFLFTSGKAHWLTIKTKDDHYVILHLDKSNYRQVMEELEAHAHIKIVILADSKIEDYEPVLAVVR